MQLTGSWLSKYLPVRCVDQRLASRLTCDTNESFDLHRFVPISEAIPLPEAQKISSDEMGLLAAYRPIGLGRIAFTAFPINALDTKDANASDLWGRLLDLDVPKTIWADSRLGTEHPKLLQEMIGLQAAPWGLAAAIVAGYVLVLG